MGGMPGGLWRTQSLNSRGEFGEKFDVAVEKTR